ncbi:Clp protease N-terminal domain-containing protein [Rathayibacter soli]|uniref:Clp protease N-terminal domain-containing protein n=1 Tax=Rathayibacter soli TaxID=3144168 RepID=UPI0027E480A3|nr:Clp protease N-terminal domain-containing protein [Glaciibacter superstes]
MRDDPNPGTPDNEAPKNGRGNDRASGGDAVEAQLFRRLHPVFIRAVDEATRRGSATVEAEHLLLAVTLEGRGAVSEALGESGLNYDMLDAALRDERARSLAVAGVTAPDVTLLTATPRRNRPGWGASAREALRRGHAGAQRNATGHGAVGHRASGRGAAGQATAGHGIGGHDRRRRMAEVDILVGILRAELGTVPRALAFAGVDRDALIDRLQQL